jgi:hypothetical protein
MHTLHYAFLIAALVCAIFASLQLSTPRINLIALALALFFASLLVTGCGYVKEVKQFSTSYTDSKGRTYTAGVIKTADSKSTVNQGP